jgi:hypothetical protein
MSKDAPNFLDFRDEWRRQTMTDTRLTPAQKNVASVIADRVSFDGKPFRLGLGYIASFLTVDTKTVGRAAHKLQDIKALEYTPGKKAGTYLYSSMFKIDLMFIASTEFESKTWQYDLINDALLSGHQSPLSKDAAPKGTQRSHAKGTQRSHAKGTPVSTTPSISIDLQGDGYKEGDTANAQAIGCADAPPLPGQGGFVELKNIFVGKTSNPRKARDAYDKEIKSGVSHEHLVACAKAQADAIRSIDQKKRPQLHRWLTEQFYDRSDGEDVSSSTEELTYDEELSL